jgi:hypothetical protein
MAYEGDILNACGLIQIDFSETYVVAVSGDGPNICGQESAGFEATPCT